MVNAGMMKLPAILLESKQMIFYRSQGNFFYIFAAILVNMGGRWWFEIESHGNSKEIYHIYVLILNLGKAVHCKSNSR